MRCSKMRRIGREYRPQGVGECLPPVTVDEVKTLCEKLRAKLQ
jgi:hypothetical protein